MNERIQLLAVEADAYADQTVHYYMGQFDGFTWEDKIKQTRDQKFAQLIVAECADVCNKIYFDNYPDAEDFERSEEGDAIKRHFGVGL